MGKRRKERKRGRNITEQILGTRVFAGIASSSRGPDPSAVLVVNQNSGRNTVQTTKDSETAQDIRGMGQESDNNMVPKDGTLPEIAKAGMGKETLSALPKEEKATSNPTTMTNLESEEPRKKSYNSREKKASEDGRETSQEVIENKVPEDGTLPETVKASMGKEAPSALPEKEKDTSDATVTNLEREEPQSKSCNSREQKASKTAPDRSGTGQEVTENKVPTDGTLPETEKSTMGKEASSALLEKEEDTSDATAAVTNLESREPQRKSCNSGEKKATEPALDRRETGQETMGKQRKKRGRDITKQILGTRVLAGLASSSRGQDYSAVSIINQNSSRETAQITVDSEPAPVRRGMGQKLTDNKVSKDGILTETTKAGTGKEASSALPEKQKDTSDATVMTNLESNAPQSKSCNSGEKKTSETSQDGKGTCHEVIENKVPTDGTLPETEKDSVGKKESSEKKQSEHAESKKALIVPSANPEIWSQPGTGETRSDSVRVPSEEIEKGNDEITVASRSADPDIYRVAFGSIRFRPWVPQSDGIEVCGGSGDGIGVCGGSGDGIGVSGGSGDGIGVSGGSGDGIGVSGGSEEIEQGNDEITVASLSADPDIYRVAFGSIRFRPWVPQSDGIAVCGGSGERLSDEETTEDINVELYGVSHGFESGMEITTNNRREIRGWRPKLIEKEEK